MLQHDHRSRSLCNRIYYGARTVACTSERSAFAPIRDTATCLRLVGMSPSMEKEQVRCASVRGTRAKRGSRHRSREKSVSVPPLNCIHPTSYSQHTALCSFLLTWPRVLVKTTFKTAMRKGAEPAVKSPTKVKWCDGNTFFSRQRWR